MNANTLRENLPLILLACLVVAVVAWASVAPVREAARTDAESDLVLTEDALDDESLPYGTAEDDPDADGDLGTPAWHGTERAAAPVYRAPAYAAPVVRTIPAGTILDIQLDDTISTETTTAGAPVSGRVIEPVVVDGRTVIPSGARISGHVVESERSKRIGGRSRISIEFTSVVASGRTRPISATYSILGKSQTKRDVATIGGATAGGAVLGRILGHDRGKEADGTTVGAVVGGAIGTAVAASNRAPHVSLDGGSTIQVRLDSAVSV